MAIAVPELIRPHRETPVTTLPVDIALLGLGQIGSAVARAIVEDDPACARIRIVGALVRNTNRTRNVTLPSPSIVTADAAALFARRPAVVIELLGGIEPAFALLTHALTNGIPVVTANKSLLAARGPELVALSARTGTPLLYEASVLAGVPFLGPLSTRPLASDVTRIEGIINGTSNYILTAMHASGADLDAALLDAQARGLVEPDPHSDVAGIDAAEKLSVLLQHFGWGHGRPGRIETTGIEELTGADISAARQLGGVIKPVVFAERFTTEVTAFVGPAFISADARLARINGAENALTLRNRYGTLFYAGPGAGPAATAATVLDDVHEITQGQRGAAAHDFAECLSPVQIGTPDSGWFIRLTSTSQLPPPESVADFLGSHGIWLRRTVGGPEAAWAISWKASRSRIERALASLASASGCEAFAIRTLEG
jgi:homoserine dehydrogenase